VQAIAARPPTADETADQFGNPDLEPEEATHASLGFETNPLEYLNIDTTLFYKDLTNLVASTDQTVVRDGETVPMVYNNEGEGRVYGLELMVRHEFANNFFGWVTYTLSRAERLDPGETNYRLFDYDQTHILTVIGSYQLPRNWEISGRWRLVTGNPTTPIVGAVFDSKIDEYVATYGEVNSARLEPFHQLDLRIDKRWIYDLWRFNVYMDVQNVYNRSNVEGYEYNFDFSRRRPQQGLPVLPIFGFRADF
jgi:outer membrane receptor protein involved in Fe transport